MISGEAIMATGLVVAAGIRLVAVVLEEGLQASAFSLRCPAFSGTNARHGSPRLAVATSVGGSYSGIQCPLSARRAGMRHCREFPKIHDLSFVYPIDFLGDKLYYIE